MKAQNVNCANRKKVLIHLRCERLPIHLEIFRCLKIICTILSTRVEYMENVDRDFFRIFIRTRFNEFFSLYLMEIKYYERN